MPRGKGVTAGALLVLSGWGMCFMFGSSLCPSFYIFAVLCSSLLVFDSLHSRALGGASCDSAVGTRSEQDRTFCLQNGPLIFMLCEFC